jgi:energy-coupling factor transport system substrate-specific component
VLAALAAALVGVFAAGTLDPTPGPGGVPAGANAFMVVLSIAFVVGVVAYAAVELAQTGRLDSIARQFGTRTIVLMGFAIAINIVLGQIVASGLRLPLYLDSIGTILVGVLAGPMAGAATGLLSNLTWTFVLGGTAIGSPYAWPFAIVAAEIGLLAGLFGYAGVFRPRPNTPLPILAAGIGVAAAVLGALAVWGILPFYRDLCAQLGSGAATGQGLCFQLFAPAIVADPLSQALGAGVLALLALAILGLVVRLVGGRDLGVVIVLVAGALCGVISAFIAAPIAALVFGGVTGSGTDLLVALFQQAGSDLQTAVLQQSLISDPIDKAIAYVVVFLALGAVSRRLVARFPQGERALGSVET